MSEHPEVQRLVNELSHTARVVNDTLGLDPVGIRAIEAIPGEHAYLCVVPGDAVVCVVDGKIATRRTQVQQAATAGLVWEHVEMTIDPEALDYLQGAAARAVALLADYREVSDAVVETLEAVRALRTWREDPLRARASLPEVDIGAGLQERAWRAYGAFVEVSEPLVQQQENLTPELVSALRVLEEAAARGGIAARLADTMNEVLRSCDDAAGELVDRHLTPLS